VASQSKFIQSVLNSHSADWNYASLMLSTPEQLVHFLKDKEFVNSKGRVTCMLNTLYAILRRVKVGKGNGPVTSTNHPAYAIIAQILSQIFQFIKSIHSLVFVQELEFVLTMSDADKGQVLGLGNHQGLAEFMKPLPVTSGLSLLASTPSPEAPDVNDRQRIKVNLQCYVLYHS